MDPTPSTPRRRRARRILRGLGVLVAVWLACSFFVAYKLTRRKQPMAPEPPPAVAWARFEGLRLKTRDGMEIGAWYAPGRDAAAPGVILIHGNGGNRSHVLNRAELVADRGCAVLLITLRAHGDSTGEFNDIGYGARADVVAAVDYLERRRPGRPVAVLGTSLGAAAALFAAEDLGRRVGGYILESPYRDLRTAVWNRTAGPLPAPIGWIAYRGLVTVAPLFVPHLDRISPVDAIAHVPAEVPILILAGDEDPVARRDEAEALHDRARSHATLHIFPGAGHVRMIQADPGRYRDAVFALLDAVAAGAARRP